MNKVLILYIPVIHKGYLELVESERFSAVYILGEWIWEHFPELSREVRALRSEDVFDLVNRRLNLKDILRPSIKVGIVSTEERLRGLLDDKSVSEIVLTDDNIGRWISETFLEEEAELVSPFLRWDMTAVKREQEPLDHCWISVEELGEEVFCLAKKELGRSPDWWRQIGAVIFQGQRIILSGHNTHMPTEYGIHIDGDPRGNFQAGEETETTKANHGERLLIAQAAREGISLSGTSLFVTTFPCPTCAWMVAEAGIRRVFYLEGYSRIEADQVLSSYGVEIIHVKEE